MKRNAFLLPRDTATLEKTKLLKEVSLVNQTYFIIIYTVMFFCQILFPSKIIITFSKVAIYSVLDSFGKYNAHMKLIVSECKTLYFQQLRMIELKPFKKRTTFFVKERKCFQRKLHQLILDCFHKLGVYVQEKNEFLHCKTMLHFWQEYYVI